MIVAHQKILLENIKMKNLESEYREKVIALSFADHAMTQE